MALHQKPFVIDTNILLDCFVFNDEGSLPLKQLLITRQLNWIATPSMEVEFCRVLSYPAVLRWQKRIEVQQMQGQIIQPCSDELTAVFSQYAVSVDEAPRFKNHLCRDPDDQKFIDLALAHQAVLLSKDKAVLKMKAQLKRQNVIVACHLNSIE